MGKKSVRSGDGGSNGCGLIPIHSFVERTQIWRKEEDESDTCLGGRTWGVCILRKEIERRRAKSNIRKTSKITSGKRQGN